MTSKRSKKSKKNRKTTRGNNSIGDQQERQKENALHQGANTKSIFDLGPEVEQNAKQLFSSMIHLFCRRGRIGALETMLKKSLDANIMDDKGQSLVSAAVECSPQGDLECEGDLEDLIICILKLLMQYGARLDNIKGGSPLHLSAQLGYAKVIKFIINNSVNVDLRDRRLRTPLHTAAEYGQARALVYLLYAKANILANDDAGMMAIHFAAYMGHVPVVEILLAKHCDINVTCHTFRTPLCYALIGNSVNVIMYLLKHDADPQKVTGALHIALSLERRDALLTILPYNININICDCMGISFFWAAIFLSYDDEFLMSILESNVDVNFIGPKDTSILMLLVLRKRFNVAVSTIHKGADVKAVDWKQRTLLHMVGAHLQEHSFITERNKETIEFEEDALLLTKELLDYGCSVNILDSDGLTILDVCHANVKFASMIIKHILVLMVNKRFIENANLETVCQYPLLSRIFSFQSTELNSMMSIEVVPGMNYMSLLLERNLFKLGELAKNKSIKAKLESPSFSRKFVTFHADVRMNFSLGEDHLKIVAVANNAMDVLFKPLIHDIEGSRSFYDSIYTKILNNIDVLDIINLIHATKIMVSEAEVSDCSSTYETDPDSFSNYQPLYGNNNEEEEYEGNSDEDTVVDETDENNDRDAEALTDDEEFVTQGNAKERIVETTDGVEEVQNCSYESEFEECYGYVNEAFVSDEIDEKLYCTEESDDSEGDKYGLFGYRR